MLFTNAKILHDKDFSRKGVRKMPEVGTVFHSIFLFFFITLNFKFLKNWKIDSLIPFLFYRIQYVLLPGGLSPIIDFSNTKGRPSRRNYITQWNVFFASVILTRLCDDLPSFPSPFGFGRLRQMDPWLEKIEGSLIWEIQVIK